MAMNLTRADRKHLNSLGCFSVNTYDTLAFKTSAEGDAFACSQLVAPLMSTATHARLYPSATFLKHGAKGVPFLVPRKGYLEFDLKIECVKGYEDFWSAGARNGEYRRGTIVVIQPRKVPLGPLLKGCVMIGMMASRYQILKGSSASAIRFAEQHQRIAERLFVFNASNGVHHAEIYPPRHRIAAEFLSALANGKGVPE
jgi:hypothetical protein